MLDIIKIILNESVKTAQKAAIDNGKDKIFGRWQLYGRCKKAFWNAEFIIP